MRLLQDAFTHAVNLLMILSQFVVAHVIAVITARYETFVLMIVQKQK